MSSTPAPTMAGPFDNAGLVRSESGPLWYANHDETYVEVLRKVAERRPDSIALIDSAGAQVTYRELWGRAADIAGGLRQAGVQAGDRVCIDLPNSLEWVATFLGAVFAGAVAVPIDQRGSEQSRAAVIADAEPRVVIGPSDPAPVGPRYTHEAAPTDLAQMLYTSGTTGAPKGVMLNHRNLASFSEITRRTFRLDANADEPLRNLVAIPLCHAAGCNAQLLPTLALGGTIVLARSANTQAIVESAARHAPDTILAVPPVYKLLTMREADALRRLTSLRRVIYGTAAIAESLVRQLRELLPAAELSNAFGMTEISNIAMLLPDEFTLSHCDSVGYPIPGVEVELRDVDSTGKGELYLRGPNMAQGYWRKPEATEETFGSGWVRSGDIATVDATGLVYIRDRVKDIINRGGEKVYSLEVENAILAHPQIDETAVLAVPDDVMGEKIGAVVVVRKGGTVTAEQLLEHLSAHIPAFAMPEHLVIRQDPLPRGSSGKTLKAQLRREMNWERSSAEDRRNERR